MDGLVMLFLRLYWDRIWIVQEALSARKKIVYRESNSISWVGLIKARDYILQQCETVGASCITVADFNSIIRTEGPRSIVIPEYIDTQRLPGLLDILLIFRNKHSSDPRDQVYGIAGLTTARDDPRFTVDYSRTISEVYRDVVKYVVTATRNIEIISVGKGKVNPEWLPSWTPDWSQSTRTESILIRSRGFDATLGKLADATFDSAGRVLRVRGISTGVIQSVAMQFDDMDLIISYENHAFYQLLLAICSWRELAKTVACNGAPQVEAFSDTICMRPYADRESNSYRALLLESFAALIKQYMPKHPLDDLLHDALLRWQNKVKKEDKLAELEEAWALVEVAADRIRGRRFFTSTAGQMGLAPYRAEAGDIICVLFWLATQSFSVPKMVIIPSLVMHMCMASCTERLCEGYRVRNTRWKNSSFTRRRINLDYSCAAVRRIRGNINYIPLFQARLKLTANHQITANATRNESQKYSPPHPPPIPTRPPHSATPHPALFQRPI